MTKKHRISKGRPVSDDPYVPHRNVYHQYRLAAIRRKIDFNLTQEQVFFLVVQDCTYCGLKPSCNLKLSAHPNFRYNGIDRVDSSLGYEESNCVPCCTMCNNAKKAYSLEEWKQWIVRLYERL